jgi:gas vesicle protein
MADRKDTPMNPNEPPPPTPHGGGIQPPNAKAEQCNELAKQMAQAGMRITSVQTALKSAVEPQRTALTAELNQLQAQVTALEAESKQLGC